MPAYIYILTNKYNTTLYIGVTSNLIKRLFEHQNNLADGFTKRYNLHKLVYFEEFDDIYNAISREKYLKGKKRSFKIYLIQTINPKWEDLGIKYNIVSHCDSSDFRPLNDPLSVILSESEGSHKLGNKIKKTCVSSDLRPQNDGKRGN